MPAFLPFSCSSAFASSISLRTSSVVCSDKRRIRSAIDSSEEAPFVVCGSIGPTPLADGLRTRTWVAGAAEGETGFARLSGGGDGARRRPRGSANLVARSVQQLVERRPDRLADLDDVRHRVVVGEEPELDGPVVAHD